MELRLCQVSPLGGTGCVGCPAANPSGAGAVVRVRSQATGAKGELMRKILVDHAAALRAKSALDVTIMGILLLCPYQRAGLGL